MRRYGSGLQYGFSFGSVFRIYHNTGYGANGNYSTRDGYGDGFGSGDGSGRGSGPDNYGVGSWLYIQRLEDVWRRA